ncbi:MAG: CPBP family intramembrane glutamic endopeptidase [Candidatus Helarchaeota archaeon]
MEKNQSFWQTRKAHALDIIIVTIAYFYIILVVAPFEQIFPILLSAYIIGGILILYIFFISQLLHKDTLAERGMGSWKTLFIRTDNLKKSAKEVLLVLSSIMVGVIFLLALIFGTITTPECGGFSQWLVEQGWLQEENLFIDFIAQFIYYIGWGLAQQILFLSFIHVRLRKVFPRTDRRNRILISLLTGGIFGSYHLFNFPLVAFTFISGTCWAWYFYETPNLLTVSISHGLGGTLSSMYIFVEKMGWHMTVGWPGLGL